MTNGQLRAINMPSNRYAPGAPTMESISVSSRALPFAGRREGGGLGRLRWERGKSPVLRKTRTLVTTGCSSSFGGGEPLPPRHAASHAGRGKVLHSRPLGPRSKLSLFQPVVGATGSGVGAMPASIVSKSGGRRYSTFGRACSARRRVPTRLTWLAARLPRKGRADVRRASRKASAEDEGEREG